MIKTNTSIDLIISPYGYGGNTINVGHGPKEIMNDVLSNPTSWLKNIRNISAIPDEINNQTNTELNTEKVYNVCHAIFQLTKQYAKQQPFICMAGDHSSAIGTWGGVADAYRDLNESIGLLWIDAHLDSHTLETTPSGNLHGVPLATLLGHNLSTFNFLKKTPSILPQNLCILGARCFEKQEHQLLQSMGVRIYYIDEIRRRSFKTCYLEALNRVSQNTSGVGISFDIDAFDPSCAPGVGLAVDNGIFKDECFEAILASPKDIPWIGIELLEYNPINDQYSQTHKLVMSLLNLFAEMLLTSHAEKQSENITALC